MVDSVGVDVPSCCVVAGVYAQACTLQDGTRVDAVRRSFIMCHSAEAVRDCECMCGWVCVNVLMVSGGWGRRVCGYVVRTAVFSVPVLYLYNRNLDLD
jgi:hypothetical protein